MQMPMEMPMQMQAYAATAAGLGKGLGMGMGIVREASLHKQDAKRVQAEAVAASKLERDVHGGMYIV